MLEETSSLKQRVYSRFGAPRYGALWVRIHWRLAQLYRKVGPDEDARKIEEELRRLLAYADRDHPILMTLNGDPQPTVIAQAH